MDAKQIVDASQEACINMIVTSTPIKEVEVTVISAAQNKAGKWRFSTSKGAAACREPLMEKNGTVKAILYTEPLPINEGEEQRYVRWLKPA